MGVRTLLAQRLIPAGRLCCYSACYFVAGLPDRCKQRSTLFSLFPEKRQPLTLWIVYEQTLVPFSLQVWKYLTLRRSNVSFIVCGIKTSCYEKIIRWKSEKRAYRTLYFYMHVRFQSIPKDSLSVVVTHLGLYSPRWKVP